MRNRISSEGGIPRRVYEFDTDNILAVGANYDRVIITKKLKKLQLFNLIFTLKYNLGAVLHRKRIFCKFIFGRR